MALFYCSMAEENRFDAAEYERESDEIMAGVMPDSWEGHKRLAEGAYPYGEWSHIETEGGFVFGEIA